MEKIGKIGRIRRQGIAKAKGIMEENEIGKVEEKMGDWEGKRD